MKTTKKFRLIKFDAHGHEMKSSDPGYRDRQYSFRFNYRGKAYPRRLETNDAGQAQARAKALFDEITEAVKSGESARLDATKLRHGITILLGEIFDHYRKQARCEPRTIENNIGAMCIVLRRALNQPGWTYADICRQSCALLTKKLVRDFQASLRLAAGDDFLAQERAATTGNSLLRQARSLFANRQQNNLLDYYQDAGIKLPDSVTDFKTAALEREPDHTFDPPSPALIARLEIAALTLRATDPNAYLIYLLTRGCGLRKKEIAFLCASHISHDPQAKSPHLIELKTRANFRTKTRKPRFVPMEDFIWREITGLNPLLAAPRSADPLTLVEDYVLTGNLDERYNKSFRRFGLWLKSLGWNRQKKAHELRKLWESQAAMQFGSNVASKLAGHSVGVHEAHYFGLHKQAIPAVNIFGNAGPDVTLDVTADFRQTSTDSATVLPWTLKSQRN